MHTQIPVKISDRASYKRYTEYVNTRFDKANLGDQIYTLERREDSDNLEYFSALSTLLTS